jgi:hypothetical protein
MRSFIIGCIAALVIAVGSVYVLDRYQEPISVATTTTGVRL